MLLGALCALVVGVPPCEDDHASCYDWALQNGCMANPAYMLKYCPASCGKCGGKRAVRPVQVLHGAFSSWTAGRESVHGEHEVHRSIARRRRRRQERMSLLTAGKPERSSKSELDDDDEGNMEPRPTMEELLAMRKSVKGGVVGASPSLPAAEPSAQAQLTNGGEHRAKGHVPAHEFGGDATEKPSSEDTQPVDAVAVDAVEEEAGILDWVEPRHIVYLFELSGLAQVAAHALMLQHARQIPTSLEGISSKTLQLQLLAVLSRAIFCARSHFGTHWIVRIEVPVAAILLILLLSSHARRPAALIHRSFETVSNISRRSDEMASGTARRKRDSTLAAGLGGGGFGGGPLFLESSSCRLAADHDFPLRSVCAGCALLAAALSLVTSYGLVTYATLAFSIFAEAAALVPQRRLLVATVRCCARCPVGVLALGCRTLQGRGRCA